MGMWNKIGEINSSCLSIIAKIFGLKLDVLFTIWTYAGEIFQIASIVQGFNKVTEHKVAGNKRQHACCGHKNAILNLKN